ncbi:MAG: hypothetical protein AB7F89_03695, partial [Pirellulaceae bacterium]
MAVRYRRLRFDVLEPRLSLAADLAPAQFNGWSDSIVISNKTGTNTDDVPITNADTVYLDIGWGNFGDVTVPANTFATTLLLDGIPVSTFITPFSLSPFTGAVVQDLGLGQLSLGVHTVSLVVDVNNSVAEGDEANNTYERSFTVVVPPTEDFGDAPTATQSGFLSSYPTTLLDNGARHTPLVGFRLGTALDADANGQPNPTADLDDLTGSTDDEDGVTLNADFMIGAASAVQVFVTNTAGVANPFLDAWIDFN